MNKAKIIEQFLNFAPVSKAELEAAMHAVAQEEEAFWRNQVAEEANQESDNANE